jgi:hypothetical protein
MLTRMGIPHGWYQAGSAAGRRLLEEAGEDGSRLPVVVFHTARCSSTPPTPSWPRRSGTGPGPRPAPMTW